MTLGIVYDSWYLRIGPFHGGFGSLSGLQFKGCDGVDSSQFRTRERLITLYGSILSVLVGLAGTISTAPKQFNLWSVSALIDATSTSL